MPIQGALYQLLVVPLPQAVAASSLAPPIIGMRRAITNSLEPDQPAFFGIPPPGSQNGELIAPQPNGLSVMTSVMHSLPTVPANFMFGVALPLNRTPKACAALAPSHAVVTSHCWSFMAAG